MTTLDVIGGVELTACAAIVIAGLSIAMGLDTAQRLRIASILSGWFVLVVILAATRVLHYEHGTGVPGVGLAVVVPIVLMWSFLLLRPSRRQAMDRAPIAIFAAVNVVRILGVSFLFLEASQRLPAPFAPIAGWGDIVVGAGALPVAWMAHRQSHGWRAARFAWNVVGIADLITAVVLGVLSSPGPLRQLFAEPGTGLMATLPWLLIPGYLVPLLFTTHLAIFHRLAHQRALARAPVGRDDSQLRMS